MQAYAVAKAVRISPFKVRQVLPLIRGKKVGDAMMALRYTPKKAARLGEKVRVGTAPYEFKGVMGMRNFVLETPDGELHRVYAGEVSVRGLYGYV